MESAMKWNNKWMTTEGQLILKPVRADISVKIAYKNLSVPSGTIYLHNYSNEKPEKRIYMMYLRHYRVCMINFSTDITSLTGRIAAAVAPGRCFMFQVSRFRLVDAEPRWWNSEGRDGRRSEEKTGRRGKAPESNNIGWSKAKPYEEKLHAIKLWKSGIYL